MTLNDTLQIALGHHNAGRLPEAEQIYRQVLEQVPDQPDALYLLGHLCAEAKRWEESARLLGRSTAVSPANAASHAVLGEVLESLGRLDDSIVAYRAAIGLDPGLLDVQMRLGHVLLKRGTLDESIATYREVISREPCSAPMQVNLAEALRRKNLLVEAEHHARRAIAIDPNFAGGHQTLGLILLTAGRHAEAIPQHQAALQLDRTQVVAWNNLGLSLCALRRDDEAVSTFERALAIVPRTSSAILYAGLGSVLLSMRRLDDAVASLRASMEIAPAAPETLANLGNALWEQGSAEAFDCYRRAFDAAPGNFGIQSNLLFALNVEPTFSARQILDEHRRWAERHVDPRTADALPHQNVPDPERRLRIGYVSADFREHPLGRFLPQLLERHDREAFEVFCYSGREERDPVAERFHAAADQWRDATLLDDHQLAELIRQDGIDVLVDANLITSGSRLIAFAHKPAPVQITYLSYAGTSGMRAMDYRISDPYLDPPGGDADRSGEAYSETTLRLRHSYWCYEPHPDAPAHVAPSPLAVSGGGGVTFGCLNQFSKVNDLTLGVWARILQGTPGSRLLLHSLPGSHRQRVLDPFSRAGVDSSRVDFIGKQPIADYYRTYDRIDIALDPFPYGGGTTTCDALWMGVPVITLRGRTAVGRGGASILSNVGLHDLIADNVGQYVELAGALAQDGERLTALRRSMRDRMRGSPLMDVSDYVGDVEGLFRTAWRTWCATAAPS